MRRVAAALIALAVVFFARGDRLVPAAPPPVPPVPNAADGLLSDKSDEPIRYAYQWWKGDVNVWRVVTTTRRHLDVPDADAKLIRSLFAVSTDGLRLAYYHEKRQRIVTHDLRTGLVRTASPVIDSFYLDDKVQELQFSPDGRYLAIYGQEKLRVVDTTDGASRTTKIGKDTFGGWAGRELIVYRGRATDTEPGWHFRTHARFLDWEGRLVGTVPLGAHEGGSISPDRRILATKMQGRQGVVLIDLAARKVVRHIPILRERHRYAGIVSWPTPGRLVLAYSDDTNWNTYYATLDLDSGKTSDTGIVNVGEKMEGLLLGLVE